MSGKGKSKKVDEGKKKRSTMTCEFRFSPVRCLKHFGGKVAAAVVRLSRRNNPPPKTTTRSVAPIAVIALDSQRSEAIHDCIDFINSSSNFPRSKSVAAATP